MSQMKFAPSWPRVAALALLAGADTASAETITFNFGSVFSGDTPAGSAPWLTATITDLSGGGVRLEIVAGGLTGQESIGALYFNLDPAYNASTLSFLRDAASTGPVASNISIGLGVDAFRADGDGFYDILLDLPPPPGSQAARFTVGEILTYQVTGPVGVTARSFFGLSSPGPGGGPAPQFAAAHIQQIGGSGSGWVGASVAAVPLPAGLGLLAAGVGLLGALRRRPV